MIAFALLGSLAFGQGADFSRVPPATTAAESRATFDARARIVLEQQALQLVTRFDREGAGHLATVAQAKLALGVDVDAVNHAFLDSAARPYARAGSDFDGIGPFCIRRGDYDFTLFRLVALAHRFWDRPDLLWPDTRRKILRELLNETGGVDQVVTHRWFGGGLCGRIPETENHILMTETSRLLTNELHVREAGEEGRSPEARHDNARNGLNEWMLRHLRGFLVRDFSEYNSRPYQAYAVMPIQNLFEFASDKRVRAGAGLVLDYLAAKFAVSSNGLRRSPPFRRQPRFAGDTRTLEIDKESQRFILMAGNTQRLAELPVPFQVGFGLGSLVPPALGAYRVPEPILDRIVAGFDRAYLQAVRHEGVEIYAGSRSFLISAGGVFVSRLDIAKGQNDGWAVATTLMPSGGGLDRANFIRIEGHRDPEKRANTCVAAGFACGLNPVVPGSIPATCLERRGHWTFVDLTAPRCPLDYGIHVAVYAAPCDTRRCRRGGDSFGFFEAAEADESGAFADFVAGTLARNDRRYGSTDVNTYVGHGGVAYEFTPAHDPKEWGIRSIGFREVETRIGKWPLAGRGPLESPAEGVVVFHGAREDVVLDYSDPVRPVRKIRPRVAGE